MTDGDDPTRTRARATDPAAAQQDLPTMMDLPAMPRPGSEEPAKLAEAEVTGSGERPFGAAWITSQRDRNRPLARRAGPMEPRPISMEPVISEERTEAMPALPRRDSGEGPKLPSNGPSIGSSRVAVSADHTEALPAMPRASTSQSSPRVMESADHTEALPAMPRREVSSSQVAESADHTEALPAMPRRDDGSHVHASADLTEVLPAMPRPEATEAIYVPPGGQGSWQEAESADEGGGAELRPMAAQAATLATMRIVIVGALAVLVLATGVLLFVMR